MQSWYDQKCPKYFQIVGACFLGLENQRPLLKMLTLLLLKGTHTHIVISWRSLETNLDLLSPN